MDLCLRYNVIPRQLESFKKICKTLLTKSKTLFEKIETGEWVHVSVVVESSSTIKTYYDGMFDSVVLTCEDLFDQSDLLHTGDFKFEVKGYVGLDCSVDEML
jgi:hypothetical protein